MSYFTKEQIALISSVTSPFYKDFFSSIDLPNTRFTSLPVATPEIIQKYTQGDHTKFIGIPEAQGVYYTSSGTTASAKLAKFDREEWNDINKLIAATHWKYDFLKNNDIVANLSFPGHASFMLVHDVLRYFPGPITEIAVGADQEFSIIVDILEKLKATVLTGVYSSFVALANWMEKKNKKNTRIHCLLGGGELLYGSQLELLNTVFPNAIIKGFVYGSTDSSLIGHNIKEYPETIHKVFSAATHFEILDEKTLEPILEENKEGIVVVTNLMRTNAPVVRYCNGDIARWLRSRSKGEPLFELIGRRYPLIKILDNEISGNGIIDLIKKVEKNIPLIRIEASLNDLKNVPELHIKFAISGFSSNASIYEDLILNEFIKIYPFLGDMNSRNMINLNADMKDLSDFSILSRKRGKLITDNRYKVC